MHAPDQEPSTDVCAAETHAPGHSEIISPVARATLSRRLSIGLWILRIVAVLLSLITTYVFLAQLAT